jgi:hypothetical protein
MRTNIQNYKSFTKACKTHRTPAKMSLILLILFALYCFYKLLTKRREKAAPRATKGKTRLILYKYYNKTFRCTTIRHTSNRCALMSQQRCNSNSRQGDRMLDDIECIRVTVVHNSTGTLLSRTVSTYTTTHSEILHTSIC